MSYQDFLHTGAETQLCERYMVAGAVCSFSTNCEQLLEVVRATFLPIKPPLCSPDFSVRFWVDDAGPAQPPWPKPYVRGLNHLVFAGFDSRSSMLADLGRRRVIGRFSAGIAADTTYWRKVVFPILLSVLAGSVGLVELHASCVANGCGGLVLIGPSRSGKSTLAMALTKAGFRLLSDDRIFCSLNEGKLLAWGIPRPLKLRREAAAWFEEFRGREPSEVQNGELVFYWEPHERLGQQSFLGCEPRLLVFLEREQHSGFYMTRMKRSEARSRIEPDLLAEAPEVVQKQRETIDNLLALPCWHLRYGGRPQEIAEQIGTVILEQFRMPVARWDNIEIVAKGAGQSKGQSQLLHGNGRAETERQDLLRRFTPTPHVTNLRLMQRTVRLETNSRSLLALTLKFFERHQFGRVRQPEFLWRVVCESDPLVQSTAVQVSAFSDLGLRYVNIGQRGFLAVDLESREAMGFLANLFLEGEPRFRHRPPLDILFCMTAASLGLTALSGGCVGVKDRGIMIFGPPNSGKTTACYFAAKLGMEFHADQVVFLDMSRNLLRAWGDPFPAVFRPETLDFLPELRRAARLSTYADLSFYYFDKSSLQARWARPVTPVCSLFLDRRATTKTKLEGITREEAVSRLGDCMLFNEDARLDGQVSAALGAVAERPVYNLQYGSDPKIAAAVIEEMLK